MPDPSCQFDVITAAAAVSCQGLAHNDPTGTGVKTLHARAASRNWPGADLGVCPVGHGTKERGRIDKVATKSQNWKRRVCRRSRHLKLAMTQGGSPDGVNGTSIRLISEDGS
jgi:hypothetical protein